MCAGDGYRHVLKMTDVGVLMMSICMKVKSTGELMGRILLVLAVNSIGVLMRSAGISQQVLVTGVVTKGAGVTVMILGGDR